MPNSPNVDKARTAARARLRRRHRGRVLGLLSAVAFCFISVPPAKSAITPEWLLARAKGGQGRRGGAKQVGGENEWKPRRLDLYRK